MYDVHGVHSNEFIKMSCFNFENCDIIGQRPTTTHCTPRTGSKPVITLILLLYKLNKKLEM